MVILHSVEKLSAKYSELAAANSRSVFRNPLLKIKHRLILFKQPDKTPDKPKIPPCTVSFCSPERILQFSLRVSGGLNRQQTMKLVLIFYFILASIQQQKLT